MKVSQAVDFHLLLISAFDTIASLDARSAPVRLGVKLPTRFCASGI